MVVIGYDGRFERFVIFRILQCTDHGLGGKAVANGIAAGTLFASAVIGPVLLRALRRLASICLKEVIERPGS
jgi:hypothetical protein